MKLKHLYIEEHESIQISNGRVIDSVRTKLFRLSDKTEVVEFTQFLNYLYMLKGKKGKPLTANSILVYSTAVIKFIDYLHEADIRFQFDKADLHYVSRIIDNYPYYLSKYSDLVNDSLVDSLREKMKGYKPNLSNNAANLHAVGVDHFLKFNEIEARAFHTRFAREHGFSLDEFKYLPVFSDVWNNNKVSLAQKIHWQNNTLLGGIIGANNYGGLSERVLKRLDSEDAEIRSSCRMTQEQIIELLSLPFLSKRDRLLYAFVHATGLRISEALMLQFSHIDFVNRLIHFKEINFNGLTLAEQQFCKSQKGRSTKNDIVHLFGDAEEIFWLALEDYLSSSEFCSDFNHDFIFVFTKGPRKGRPLLLVNQARRNKRSLSNIETKYKKALIQVGVDYIYGFHIARHTLINYLLNDYPTIKSLPDGTNQLIYGLEIKDVKKLIGHESLSSTLKYTKTDESQIKAQHSKARVLARTGNLCSETKNLIELKIYHEEQAKKINQKIAQIEKLSAGIPSV
ncbi:tyrosine-type recombinase/integrase [Vibrio alginolyticus]|uniref:tyrosine-type recombinase/integrase n=1 Tax=Vibrio alginolyticus TaxID=663 RepID=UPI002FF14BB6